MNRFFYEPKNQFCYKKIDTSFENNIQNEQEKRRDLAGSH